MVHVTQQQRKRLLHTNVATPFLQQILVETAAIGDLGQAVDACLLAFLRRIVALINENLDQDFEVAFLPRHRLNKFLQFLLRSLDAPSPQPSGWR